MLRLVKDFNKHFSKEDLKNGQYIYEKNSMSNDVKMKIKKETTLSPHTFPESYY